MLGFPRRTTAWCDGALRGWRVDPQWLHRGCSPPPPITHLQERLWYAKATVQGPRNDCAQWNCTVDDATIVAVTGAWPPEAQAIIDASGAAA